MGQTTKYQALREVVILFADDTDDTTPAGYEYALLAAVEEALLGGGYAGQVQERLDDFLAAAAYGPAPTHDDRELRRQAICAAEGEETRHGVVNTGGFADRLGGWLSGELSEYSSSWTRPDAMADIVARGIAEVSDPREAI